MANAKAIQKNPKISMCFSMSHHFLHLLPGDKIDPSQMAPTLRQAQRQAPKAAVHLLGAFNVERGTVFLG